MSALKYNVDADEDEQWRVYLKEEALKYIDQVLMPQVRLDNPRSTDAFYTRRRLQLIQKENREIDAKVEQRRAEKQAWRAMQREAKRRGEQGDRAPDKYADL